MDPNDDIEFVDSGMGSNDESPKSRVEPSDAVPSGQVAILTSGNSETGNEYDDEPDETLGERLWGLTEMFPEGIRNTTYGATTNTWGLLKALYGFTRVASWVVASSSVILFAPVIFEVERAQMEEMQRTPQRQVLFGPPPAGGMPAMPPLQR